MSVLDLTLRSLVCAAAGQGLAVDIQYRPLRCGGRLRDVERDAILGALTAHHGHRKQAAIMLGITTRALSYKMAGHGISTPRRRARLYTCT